MLTVTARTRVVGFHRWPAAPEARAYLRDRHRHEFHLTATVAVDHSGRDVEFHDLQDAVHVELPHLADGHASDPASQARWWPSYDFGTRSCEALATGLAGRLEEAGYRVLSVTWSEDGENDATWTPDVLPGYRVLTPTEARLTEPTTAEVPRQVDTGQAIPLASYTGGLPAVTARQDSGR